ncbi:uncharacterized protein METZ01_LOCUS367277, partial [marine metagenome]
TMGRHILIIALSILVTGSFGSFNTPASAATTKPLPASGKVELMLGADGEMPTTIYVPEGTGIKPLILVIHASGGMMDADHDYAKALRKEGYISVVPDFFTSYDITQKTKTETWTDYRDDIHKDFTTIISQVKSMSKIPSKNVFAVGFSNGGYWAAALAARGDIDAGVSYYGAYSEGGTVRGRSAIESASIISEADSDSAPLLMFHGTDDSFVPFEVAKIFEDLYPNVEAHYYDDVEHIYERKGKFDYYDEEAAKDSWGKTLKFLKQHRK